MDRTKWCGLKFKTLLCPLVLLLASCASGGQVNEQDRPCVVAFDMGSSGVRAGENLSDKQAEQRFDYFTLFANTGSLNASEAQLTDSFKNLPVRAKLNSSCKRIGGGFSVWRMAQSGEPDQLNAMLQRLYENTGVAVFVIPQHREGHYAFQAAKAKLGDLLDSSHILDIGGGSFQVAGADTGFGLQLGQKSIYQVLCKRLRAIRNSLEGNECQLEVLSIFERDTLRQYMQQYLQAHLVSSNCKKSQCPQSLTAISKPVTKGVYPLLTKLEVSEATGVISFKDLNLAVNTVSTMKLSDLSLRLGTHSEFNKYLISDLIFLEALSRWLNLEKFKVAEVDVNNVYGLTRDPVLLSLSDQFPCYLSGISRYPTKSLEELDKNCKKIELERNSLQ